MNKLKFLILPFILAFGLLSCGDSNKDDDEIGGGCVFPPVPGYQVLIDVSLHADYKVTHEDIKEEIINVKHSVADAQSLIYVVHRNDKSWEHVVDGKVFRKHEIEGQVKDGKFTIDRLLPEGDYYVSIIAFMNTEISPSEISVFLAPLEQNYGDVVVQVPNDYVYYKTMEIKVTSDGAKNKAAIDLDKITSEMVYEFYDAPNIPASKGKYNLTVGVENIPSAFFLATGTTLTNEESEKSGRKRYTGERKFEFTATPSKALVTQFHTLSNDKLPNESKERGTLGYSFKNGNEVVKESRILVGEFSPETNFHVYIEQLLSTAPPTTIDKFE